MKKYRVLPEFYDEWAADEKNNIVSEDFVLQMTHPNEWNIPLEELLKQLEEIDE